MGMPIFPATPVQSDKNTTVHCICRTEEIAKRVLEERALQYWMDEGSVWTWDKEKGDLHVTWWRSAQRDSSDFVVKFYVDGPLSMVEE